MEIDLVEDRAEDSPVLALAYPWTDTSVRRDAVLALYFTGKSGPQSLTVSVNGDTAYSYGTGFLAPYNGPYSSETLWKSQGYVDPNGIKVNVDRTGDYDAGASVRVDYAYEDDKGRALKGSFTFMVEDYAAPTLHRVVLGKGSARELLLYFDEALESASVDLTSDDGFVPGIVSTEITGSLVRVTLDEEMSFEASYEVSYTVADTSGNEASGAETVATEAYHLDCSEKMPAYWLARLDEDGNLKALCDLFSEVLSLAHKDIDYYRRFYDVDEAYSNHVTRHLRAFGGHGLVTDFVTERRLLRMLFDLYRKKGIKVDLPGIIYSLVGVTPQIEEWWEDKWTLGVSRLGEGTVLADGSESGPFTFRVIFGRALTDAERQTVERALDFARPANTQYIIVEPVTEEGYWTLGVSKLGVDTVLGDGTP